MKKLYTTAAYKKYHLRQIKSANSKKRKRKKSTIFQILEKKKKRESGRNYNLRKSNPQGRRKIKYNAPLPIYAPADFRLVENTEDCLIFFRDIRERSNIYSFNKQKVIILSLQDVMLIDYATISALTAISDDLNSVNIILQGDFPKDIDCRKFIIDSGFLNHMVDGNNRPFLPSGKSKMIFFEKGAGKLSRQESYRISEMIKDVVEHLTGERKLIKPIKSILLEICGNSIEHSNTKSKQWLLGVKYIDKKVVFSVTDVGKGIIETLHKKHWILIKDKLLSSNIDVLKGAFNQKYGSSTQEQNRNKGLPSIKFNSETGTIKNLIVLTNNVILHFSDENASRVLKKGFPRFKGTLYQWELTSECVLNTINYTNENN